ncbi:MAG: helix-turn-helix domain-containing protein [Bacteroidetes bacterium]|nr:helix-turn-helix domain-containing protein [Bacteroidota bacterium]MBU1718753.1 helix-turn-helix domain-containing protein [Bacteroidota bacterium]
MYICTMAAVGKFIREKVKERGMSNAEFARRINTHVRNVYDIYERESLDTTLLSTISQVLEYNFFAGIYQPAGSDDAVSESNAEYGRKDRIKELEFEVLRMQSELDHKGQIIEHLQKEIEYLKEIVDLKKSTEKAVTGKRRERK